MAAQVHSAYSMQLGQVLCAALWRVQSRNLPCGSLHCVPHLSDCTGEQEGEDDSRQGAAGGSSSQEHVRTIAALQRVQASQANYSNDPALDISRPKLRDNR